MSDYARVARAHLVDDNAVLEFFKRFVSRIPVDERDLRGILDDPNFNAGFVAGLMFSRKQRTGEEIKKGDSQLLLRLIEEFIEATKHTPHITNN